MGGTLAAAVCTFVFWTTAARLVPASTVGVATTAIAATNLLLSLCDLGLGTSVIYAAARYPDRTTSLINTTVALGWCLSATAAVVFLLGSTFWAKGLQPLWENPTLILTFIAFTICNYLLMLADAILLSHKRSNFVFWRNIACNVPCLVLLPVLYGWGGGQTVLLAFAIPNIVTGIVVGLWVLPRTVAGYQFWGRWDVRSLRGVVGYGLATHITNLLWGGAGYLLPLIAINHLSATDTGYFYIGWSVVNVVLMIPRAVTAALFVDGSRQGQKLRGTVLRATALIGVLVLPLIALLGAVGDNILQFFGDAYVNMSLLQHLLVSAIPFAFNSVVLMVLRIQHRMKLAITFSGAVAAAVLFFAYQGTKQAGIIGLADGWLWGHILMAGSALVVLLLRTGQSWLRRSVAGIGVGFAVLVLLALPARAQSTTAPSSLPCTAPRLEAPTAAIPLPTAHLLCDLTGEGSANDHVTVVRRVGAFPAQATQWVDLGDYRRDTWLFDVDNNGTVELVVQFNLNDTTATADLYDVPEGAAGVSYSVSAVGVSVTPATPTIHVAAQDGWWQRQTHLNYNLDITVDGTPEAVFDTRGRLQGILHTDGNPDVTIHVRDEDGDGQPNLDWRTITFQKPLPPIASLIPRTYLMVNARDDEPVIQPVFPFPLLGHVTYGYATSSASQRGQPPIQMAWSTGTLYTVGEMVSSRANDGQWFVYSFNEARAGQTVTPNFESPFAWYDLAADGDAQPELAIRHQYYVAQDPLLYRGRYPAPVNIVRYSWDQNNDGGWDYKLGLVGSHPITSTVTLPALDLSMTLLPYESAPTTLRDATWGPTTFVAAEKPTAGEGIYEWDPPAWLVEAYYTGATDSPTAPPDAKETLAAIGAGFRGEYRLTTTGPARLYVSAIDYRLHLLGAEAGIWQIDDSSTLTYANLDGDTYLDQWVYTNTATAQHNTLIARAGHQLYFSGDQVTFSTSPLPPALWETIPPATHAEWQTLRAQLAALSPPNPEHLHTMLLPAGGPEMKITRATVSDYRAMENDGYRFVLTLEPGFSVEGVLQLPLNNLAPGAYVVSQRTPDSPPLVVPVTPAQVSLQIDIPTTVPAAGEATSLMARVNNEGGEDAGGVTLVVRAINSTQEIQVYSDTLSVPAGVPQSRRFTWTPLDNGTWTLHAYLTTGGTVLSEQQTTLEVAVPHVASPVLLTGLVPEPVRGVLIILLLLLATTIGIVFGRNQTFTAKALD